MLYETRDPPMLGIEMAPARTVESPYRCIVLAVSTAAFSAPEAKGAWSP
jgi:hypothetical protein